jgi:muconate cycloisomerase
LNELCTLIRGALGRDGNPAKAGVDIALHDLVGKALNVPVHQLLGGRLRERCGLSVSLNMAPPEEMAAEAVDYLAQGFGTLKLKAGLDQRHDLAALEAIRGRIGADVPLRVDINAGWSMAKEGLRWVRQFERFGLEFVEQPAKAHDIEGLAFIRERSPVPIMADESVWTAADALAVIRRGAADLINIYVMEAGGLREAKLAAGVCEAAGMPVMLGSMPEFGIGTAAQLHLGVTLPNLIEANDLCGFLYHREDVIEPTLVVENGTIEPPPGPGLGVTVARDRLERWRVG